MEAGYSLIEVIVASALIGIVSLGSYEFITRISERNNLEQARDEATQITNQFGERMRKMVVGRNNKSTAFTATMPALNVAPFIELRDCDAKNCKGVRFTASPAQSTDDVVVYENVCRPVKLGLTDTSKLSTIYERCNIKCPSGEFPAIRIKERTKSVLLPSNPANPGSPTAMAFCIEKPVGPLSESDDLQLTIFGALRRKEETVMLIPRATSIPLSFVISGKVREIK